ncbi:MAG: WD40 repeat domain-containing protein [Bryobacterales bacterium]|nr:WD40 repeat domain-containing protein [Bryobacterales bacterium]
MTPVSRPASLIARVYDRANAPEPVLELLRLTKSKIRSYVLTFKPKDEWKVGPHGALTATPDGSRLITSGGTGPFRFWNADSHMLLTDIPETRMPLGAGRTTSSVVVAGLTLSPDGSLLAVEGNYMIDLRDAATLKGLHHFQELQNEGQLYRLFNPQFTKDGRYLLIQSNQPALLAFDTRTLRRVVSVPGVPPGAAGFFPAPHAQRSVYTTVSGEIALWNQEEKRKVAPLDSEGRIVRIAYSPDESMVAAVTFHNESDSVG